MADNARGLHVSPGVYSREISLDYAVKSLGITTLGLVGETQKGPAFQQMAVTDWRDFVSTFGGTSTEKYKGSQYPKYELPYIAKSYLTQSNQLEVVRVLGLSGYNAGPAWVVTAEMSDDTNMVVAVLRPRGQYYKYRKFDASTGTCACPSTSYDSLVYDVGETTKKASMCDAPVLYNPKALELSDYTPLYSSGNDCEGYNFDKENTTFDVSATNLGRFKIRGIKGIHEMGESYSGLTDDASHSGDCFEYAVSLNPNDKDYIVNVLGTNPADGDAPIYVESLYDVSLRRAISNDGTTEARAKSINGNLTFYQVYYTADFDGLESIAGIMTVQEDNLSRKYIGQRFLADEHAETADEYKDDSAITFHLYNYETQKPITSADTLSAKEKAYWETKDRKKNVNITYDKYGLATCVVKPGQIYTVAQYTTSDGKRLYFYRAYTRDSIDSFISKKKTYKYNGKNDYKTEEAVIDAANAEFSASSYVYKSKAYPASTDVLNALENDLKEVTGLTNYASFRGIVYKTKDEAVDVADALVQKSGNDFVYIAEDGKHKTFKEGSSAYTDIEKEISATTSGVQYFYGDTIYTDKPTAVEKLSGSLISIDSVYVDKTTKNVIAKTIGGLFSVKGITSNDVDKVPLLDNLEYPGTFNPNPTDDKYDEITYSNVRQTCVKNLSDGLYYRLKEDGRTIDYVSCNLNDYKSAYRYASTPWIVSNLMGDYDHIELKKLFRFHTISDGKASNNEVKVSIENIKPDDGTFDVVVRDINDTDEYQVPLEKFSKCSLVPGTSNYIAYKIGSYDGMYESKSNYITVECKEGDEVESAVPAGFLGYPETQYAGTPIVDIEQNIANPLFTYNREYDEDVKNRKQYFGLSTRVGVDLDMFTFKGNAAYIDRPEQLTHGFHLDSRLSRSGYEGSVYPKVTVDGELGYEFDAVSQNSRTSTLTDAPIIGTEEAMTGTIYEYVNLRKFTVYFYGGFDGWDEFRTSRTNTDDFKASKYLGTYDNNSGEGYAFNRIEDTESIGLNQNGITSDWYAYLAGIRQFANPEAVDINVFATPGIDYVNNTSLVEEAIEMIEEERADSIYVVTTPDKPSGAGDFVDEMYTPDDAVYNLEDTEINSNYTCTYYPWVKYLDEDNNQYIYLPPTKDAVRNFAQTDNQYQSWFAPAGLNRGTVDCVRAHYVTKLADEDTLYEGRINPVKTFATDGVKIWGQKNLQVTENQLNRIAVRRLLLRMRKLIAIACRSLIFEPNDSVTKNSFLSTVTPILDNIRSNRGISDYKIEVNDTVESRERRELPAKIFFKPSNALEYIVLDFILTPEGVSFSDL